MKTIKQLLIAISCLGGVLHTQAGNPDTSSCGGYFTYIKNGNTVNFTAYSNTPGVSYNWSLGDGISSYDQNPTHSYAPGTYSVCMTIKKDSSCSFTYCDSLVIKDSLYIDSSNVACKSYFTYVVNGNNVSFTGYSNTPGVNYSWSLGDGISSSGQNPTHSYAPGTYSVCMTTKKDSSCSFTYCDSLVIKDSLYMDSSNVACKGYFTYAINGNTVSFWGHSNKANVEYAWSFGDAAAGTLQDTKHDYPFNGVYQVCMEIYDNKGCHASYCQYITVGDSLKDTLNNYHTISGKIMAGKNFLDAGYVYLLRKDNDKLAVVDTTFVDSLGYYHFNKESQGDYLLKAMPSVTSNYFSTYLPTYYGDVVYWEKAQDLHLNQDMNGFNINLVFGYVVDGTGKIGGKLSSGTNKKAGAGEPVANANILLMDINKQPLAHAITNADGYYSFANIAFASYNVYVEMENKTSAMASVTLNENNATVTSTDFIVGSNSIVVAERTGINTIENEMVVIGNVYPNPVADNASIEIIAKNADTFKVRIINAMGEEVYQTVMAAQAGKQTVGLPIRNLPEGIYSVVISSGNNLQTKTFIKAH